MYFVGIDISKYKHDCFITTESGEFVTNSFTIKNNKDGFLELLTVLKALNPQEEIRIGFEATAHYALNLKLFLEKAHYSFMEFNPVLLAKYNKSQTLRRTKTDAIDCSSIARWLMTVDYKPYPVGFYHTYSLKSLTRLRDTLVKQRSFYIVKITNVLDHTFPEFKPFFHNRFSKTSLYLLETYGSAEKMARMNSASYDNLRKISRGKFSMQKFLKLKELATNTVGEDNEIFSLQLQSLINLHNQAAKEVNLIEEQIISLIQDIQPKSLTIPGIGALSAAVIYAEYGDLSKYNSPSQMLSFAGLEPGYYHLLFWLLGRQSKGVPISPSDFRCRLCLQAVFRRVCYSPIPALRPKNCVFIRCFPLPQAAGCRCAPKTENHACTSFRIKIKSLTEPTRLASDLSGFASIRYSSFGTAFSAVNLW
ncbi:transposase [Anaerotaenia torta]|uniref:IS110 family transposase n=1 Tax=Anaerotaenia torta TaxID=433293 RepID=UPI003D1A493F